MLVFYLRNKLQYEINDKYFLNNDSIHFSFKIFSKASLINNSFVLIMNNTHLHPRKNFHS